MTNKSFIKDFSWYFLGSFIPLCIGFIKTPVFTRHFNKEEYGYLGIVTIIFSYLGMLLFSWIGSCIWRYYTKYHEKDNLKALYSNLIFLYLVAFFVLLIITSVWYLIAENQLVKSLILYSFFQLILNQLFLFYMVIVRLKGKARFYTFFQSIRVLISLSIALILVFIYKKNISALISSLVIVDVFSILFLMVFNPAQIKLSFKLVKKENLIELSTYGVAGLIINIGFLIIASSDRYMIAWLSTIENVGVYDQVYKISQLSVVALVTIYFNTINPSLLKELEINFKSSVQLIRKHMNVFIIYGLPIVVYLSIFSKEIANILLGKDFREGYMIMPFIFLAAFMHGISNFYELRLKFSDRLKRLSIVITGASIFNIILNYIFVGLYGYKSAAVTTAVTYSLLLLTFHFFDKKIVKSKSYLWFKNILVLVSQIVIYLIINNVFELYLIAKLIIGLLFTLSYILIFKKDLVELKYL